MLSGSRGVEAGCFPRKVKETHYNRRGATSPKANTDRPSTRAHGFPSTATLVFPPLPLVALEDEPVARGLVNKSGHCGATSSPP